jgi:hypothetical protein
VAVAVTVKTWTLPPARRIVENGGRHSAEGAEMASDFDLYREARFFWRTVTAVWGVTHIALLLAVTLIVQTQSTGTALSFNRVVPWILTGVLLAWTFWWGERLKAQRPPGHE